LDKEYRFIIPGRAYSGAGKNATSYKAKIHEIAAGIITQPFTQNFIRLKVDYFHKGKHRVDRDNLLKCISDGLKGVAYSDDSQIGHAEAFDHDTTSSFTYEEPISPEINDWLRKDEEFVAVVIRLRRILRVEVFTAEAPAHS
jgi:hypothetical protein